MRRSRGSVRIVSLERHRTSVYSRASDSLQVPFQLRWKLDQVRSTGHVCFFSFSAWLTQDYSMANLVEAELQQVAALPLLGLSVSQAPALSMLYLCCLANKDLRCQASVKRMFGRLSGCYVERAFAEGRRETCRERWVLVLRG